MLRGGRLLLRLHPLRQWVLHLQALLPGDGYQEVWSVSPRWCQAASCGYTVATQPGVCTIRLELATFLLHGPTDNTVTDLGKCGIISVYLAIAVLCRGQVHH